MAHTSAEVLEEMRKQQIKRKIQTKSREPEQSRQLDRTGQHVAPSAVRLIP